MKIKEIYNKIILKENTLNSLINFEKLNNDISLSFSIKRNLNSTNEIIKKEAPMLTAKLTDIEDNPKLYPSKNTTEQILKIDETPNELGKDKEEIDKKIAQLAREGKYQEIEKITQKAGEIDNPIIKQKDKTFHYLPYNFKQSNFEKQILEKILNLDDFLQKELEIYYNGERGLTEFVIDCYSKKNSRYKYIGRYTTDFLVIKRDKNKAIEKILILETKGKIYAQDEIFKQKKEFVNGEFIAKNNEKFGYKRFDFLYIEDSEDIEKSLANFNKKIQKFF